MVYPTRGVTDVPLVLVVGADQDKLAVPLGTCCDAITVTVELWVAVPAGPEQLMVYVVLVVRGAVEREPLMASAPDQPPEPAHDVALVEDQASMAVLPLEMVVGFALKLTAGAAAATVTVADCAAVPPLPVQVSTNLVVALKAKVV